MASRDDWPTPAAAQGEVLVQYDELCENVRVVGIHQAGAYAQYVTAPARNLHVVPADISPAQATGLALSGAVASLALHLGAHVIAASRSAAEQVPAPAGTLVSSGAFLGRPVQVDLPRLYLQGQRIVGVRSGNAASSAALWTEVDRGFRPVPDTTFPLQDAAGAHRYLEDRQNVGWVSLLIPPVEAGAATPMG